MANKRKQISKKLRFEIFKRDSFTCQYCGSTPPAVVLHVDHIVAVAAGGGNESDNLVTSCLPCNLGKGARSLESVPQSLTDKACDIQEKEEQLRGYHEIIESKRNRIIQECWRVAEIIKPGCGKNGFGRDDLKSIGRFIEKIGLFETIDAAEIGFIKYPRHPKKAFLYFCGVCWNVIRSMDGEK